ncbi:MAG: hypothetical protein U0793_14845 [Gemmataceae bacterium]
MEKILVMNVAAQLAQAVATNFPDNLPIDPEIKDPNLRAMNLAVWEEFRIFYRAVVQALSDETSWPSPQIPTGSLLPNLVQSLAPIFANNPQIQTLLNGLLNAIPKPAAAPTGPLPDPGQKK